MSLINTYSFVCKLLGHLFLEWILNCIAKSSLIRLNSCDFCPFVYPCLNANLIFLMSFYIVQPTLMVEWYFDVLKMFLISQEISLKTQQAGVRHPRKCLSTLFLWDTPCCKLAFIVLFCLLF